jgi:hypothetical protein
MMTEIIIAQRRVISAILHLSQKTIIFMNHRGHRQYFCLSWVGEATWVAGISHVLSAISFLTLSSKLIFCCMIYDNADGSLLWFSFASWLDVNINIAGARGTLQKTGVFFSALMTHFKIPGEHASFLYY